MTRDSEEEPQRTVAELLAQHGAKPDATRRRRRRAAEDDGAPEPDISQTGPQAIIDRVSGHTPPPANRPPGGRRAKQAQADAPPPPERHQQPPQQSQGLPLPPRPGRPPQNELPPRPPRGRREQPPQPPEAAPGASGYFPTANPGADGPGGLAGLDGPARTQPEQGTGYFPPPGQQPSGSFAAPARPARPPRRPGARRQPPPEPSTEQFPAVGGPEGAEAGPGPENELPAGLGPGGPAGLARWRKKRQKVQTEDTEVGIEPIDPSAVAPPGIPPRGGQTAYQAPVRSAFEEPAGDFAGASFADSGFGGPQPGYDRTDYGAENYDAEDYGAADYNADRYDDEQAEGHREDGYKDDDDQAEGYAEDDYADEESPGKQWAMMGAQLVVGVLGGAAVWLGFNWLWGKLPAAALIVAVIVIAGLVWIVRKIRRAEDLQTTVLTLLVGLVVTVSPAALLLVAR